MKSIINIFLIVFGSGLLGTALVVASVGLLAGPSTRWRGIGGAALALGAASTYVAGQGLAAGVALTCAGFSATACVMVFLTAQRPRRATAIGLCGIALATVTGLALVAGGGVR